MIEKYSFGKIVIDGKRYKKDIKIIGGSVLPDWYRKSGHIVEIGDIEDILEAKPDILVIGKGKPGLMKVSDSLSGFLEKNGIELIEEKTSAAVRTFSDLHFNGKNVAGGFHLTC